MNRSVKLVSATGGFSGFFWRVTDEKGATHIVHATSNYDACDAVGSRFSLCTVVEMKLVEACRGN